MVLRRLLAAALCGLVLAACTAAPATRRSERGVELVRPPRDTTVYIVPFRPLLAPEEIAAGIFDRFVDGFNARTTETGLTGVILKRDPQTIAAEWLAAQYYVTGDVISYREESGCCSTELRVKTRVLVFQPGNPAAVLRIQMPYDTLFDHDRSNLDAEKAQLVQKVAEQLRDAVLAELAPN